MSRDNAYLWDMLHAAITATEYGNGLSIDDLDNNQLHTDAIIRQLSVLGEAARRVSVEFKSAHPNIQWSEIIGLRNHLVHEYDTIDIETVWNIVNSDLPELIKALRAVDLSAYRLGRND